MLVEDMPVGVVSVKECLIEDLYILPDKQKMGYGTKLLRFAIEQCTGIPTLWILGDAPLYGYSKTTPMQNGFITKWDLKKQVEFMQSQRGLMRLNSH